MAKIAGRIATEPSHPFIEGNGAPPKRISVNIRGSIVHFRLSTGASWMSDMQALYLSARNEELAEYGFKITVFLANSKEHLRHKLTLTAASDAGKHLNKRYDVDVSQMSLSQVESAASNYFNELLDDLDYAEQPARIAAVATIKSALIDAGYNVNVPYPVSGGGFSLSCPFQVPATGRVYIARLQLKPPFDSRLDGYVSIAEARTGQNVVVVNSSELNDLPKPDALSKYVKRVINDFKKSAAVTGSTQLAEARIASENGGLVPEPPPVPNNKSDSGETRINNVLSMWSIRTGSDGIAYEYLIDVNPRAQIEIRTDEQRVIQRINLSQYLRHSGKVRKILRQLPKGKSLSMKMVEDVVDAIRSSTAVGSTRALSVVANAFALARRHSEQQQTPPISEIYEDAPSRVKAFNKQEYEFEIAVRDEVELRYKAQLGAKSITMSISDEMNPGQGYTVLLFPSPFDTFDTERVNVKVTKLDHNGLRKATEAVVKRWVELFNDGLPPQHHLRVHGRAAGERALSHFSTISELPKTLLISGKSFAFDRDIGIERVELDIDTTREWCYFTCQLKPGRVVTIDFMITSEAGADSNLEVRIFSNSLNNTLGMFSRHGDSFDLKEIIKHIETHYIKRAVSARVAAEPQRITQWTDLPKELVIFGKKFKRRIFNVEHVPGVKARWFSENGSQSLTWQYNAVQFRTQSNVRIPTFYINVLKTPAASVNELIAMIEQGVKEKQQ